VWQLGAEARPDESMMEGPARDRHRRHRRLPRPGRRQGRTPRHRRRPSRKEGERLPNTEPKLLELFAKLKAKHGTVLVVVDQPASIGALPLAVARNMGYLVAYLPGLTMRRIADLYPGEGYRRNEPRQVTECQTRSQQAGAWLASDDGLPTKARSWGDEKRGGA
jgi:hypothetical protein